MGNKSLTCLQRCRRSTDKDHDSTFNQHPVNMVTWAPLECVQANDWNPNSVASPEMRLLYISISHDGLTQPVVTTYDQELDRFIVVDGFHRYFTVKSNPDLRQSTDDHLPIVVLQNKSRAERMAATVRHNRARGKHTVEGMSSMVFQMLDSGMSDTAICNELGLSAEELLRLKHITGFSKLFADARYHRAWVTKRQVQIRQAFEASQ